MFLNWSKGLFGDSDCGFLNCHHDSYCLLGFLGKILLVESVRDLESLDKLLRKFFFII